MLHEVVGELPQPLKPARALPAPWAARTLLKTFIAHRDAVAGLGDCERSLARAWDEKHAIWPGPTQGGDRQVHFPQELGRYRHR